jgi:hypothetical protein
VLKFLDAFAGAWQLVLSDGPTFRVCGAQQLVKPAKFPISGFVGFFMVRPAFPSASERRTAIRSMRQRDRTVR